MISLELTLAITWKLDILLKLGKISSLLITCIPSKLTKLEAVFYQDIKNTLIFKVLLPSKTTTLP
jgi:hypothetical protein